MHEAFMHRCLELAKRAQGKTGVNPMVGAVLVRDGDVIAEGMHQGFGEPHAEAHLFHSYTKDIRPSDILYVNLEPCCHTNKKTPPCTDLLLKQGIKHVVYGMKDPNPEVSGKGIELLIKNSVQVSGPILEQECKRLNRGFVSIMTRRRPWITLKKAVTLDGKIAKTDGSFLKITNLDQDRWSHAFLRARHDAILVGVGTLLADNPRLTIRHTSTTFDPWKVVLDANIRIPLDCNLMRETADRTIVVTQPNQDTEKIRSLEKRGVRVLVVKKVGMSFLWDDFFFTLMTPRDGFSGISSILVEGGTETWKSFQQARYVDEEVTLLGSE